MLKNNLFYQRIYLLTGKKLNLNASDLIVNVPSRYGPLFGNKQGDQNKSLCEVASFVHKVLSREEEYGDSNLDKYGRFDHDKSFLVQNELDESPIIDELILDVIKQLNLNRKNIWPEGKKAAVCLTHDVDHFDGRSFIILRKLWWHFHALKSLVKRHFEISKKYLNKIRRWGDSNYDPVYAFNKWMALEDKYGFRSTFFFFGLRHALSREGRLYSYSNERVRKTIRLLYRNGWDIGLHAGYFQNLKLDSLRKQKMNLENAIDEEIFGCRQHYLRVRFPESWKLYEKAGFLYSTNMAWGGGKQGFRAGTCFPYKPLKYGKLIEIPFQLMDMPIIQKPDEYYNLFIEFLEKIKKVGGCFVIDFHQEYFDEIEAPGVNKTYRWILKELARDKDLWVTRLKDVVDNFSSSARIL